MVIERGRLGRSLDTKPDRPVYPIGVVADHLGVSGQTLRLYESRGLLSPARRNGERYYSTCDVRWLECLRRLIHKDKLSLEGVRQLLRFAPCWQVVQNIWIGANWICKSCPVYLGGARKVRAGAASVPLKFRRAATR